MKTNRTLKSAFFFILLFLNATGQSQTQTFTGPVGIGTTTPTFPLDVNGVGQFLGGTRIGSGPQGFYGDGSNHAVRAFNVANSGFFVQPYNGGNTYLYVGQMGTYAGRVGIGTVTPVSTLHINSGVNKNLVVRSATDFSLGVAGIGIQSINDANNANLPIEIESSVLLLNPGTMGNVGIGTAAPLSQLHVSGSNATFTLTNSNGGAGSTSSFNFQTYNSGFPSSSIKAIDEGAYSSNLTFLTKVRGADNNALAERMRIDTYGNVGIGTTTPSSKLQIGSISNTGGIQTASPTLITMDASYGTGVLGTNFKLKLFQDNASNTYGLGVSGNLLEISSGSGGGIGLFTNKTTQAMTILSNGNIGIGTTNPNGYKLAVNGAAIFTKVQVKATSSPWPDYVFHPTYELRSLSSLESYINEFNHLPDMPSAGEVEKDGLDIGATQTVLLKKIEELTLYVIELNKKIEKLEAKKSNQ